MNPPLEYGGARASNARAVLPLNRRQAIAMVAACPFPANHGTPGAIRELSVALARLGHEVHVVTYPHGEHLAMPGLHVHRVPSAGSPARGVTIGPSWGRLAVDALLVPKLVHVVRCHRIDVIHAHNYEAALAGALAKWVTGVPLVYNGINSMADELPSYDFLRPAALARTLGKLLDRAVPRTGDAAIVLSDELRAYLVALGLDAQRVVVLPPGVEAADFAGGDGSAIRSRHGLHANTPIVTYTGALEGFQRVDLLVRAMRRVLDARPDAVLLIANNIPNAASKAALLALAHELGIASRIIVAESVSLADLPSYLAAADVAVVPRPTCPGFPIKLLNYMAAGKAIVSFEGGAKALCHGYNGYVARNDDVDDLADGIRLFLDDRRVRETVGRRARESLHGVYDWETIALATTAVYEQLAAGRRIDPSSLGAYVKASYTPRYTAGGRDNPGGFLQSGPIEYPTFTKDESRVTPRAAVAS